MKAISLINHSKGAIGLRFFGLGPNLKPTNGLIKLKKLDFNNKLEGFDKKIYEKIHHPKNLKPVKLSENISFTKSITRLEQISFEKEKYDLVFFDAFAPSKQPDIWSKENFKLIKDAMKTSGVIVTYSSSSKLKNILKELKFEIEILQGPKGKKEMTRATK